MHIDRVADLPRLLSEPRGPLTLDLQELDASRDVVERRILSEYNECGCAAATIGLLSGLAAGMVLMWPLAMPWWGQGGVVLLGAIAASGLGKWIGRASAHRRLEQTIALVLIKLQA
jgi:hypothetical protein